MNPHENIEEDLNRPFYLPRLDPKAYQGNAKIHWTQSTLDRKTGWLDDEFHSRFRELLLHAQVRGSLFCPVYCLMPDHIHLVWMGCSPDSDQRKSMAFLRTYLEPCLQPAKFQHQAQDHVFRPNESRTDVFATVCGYVKQNPVKAGLVSSVEEWPYTGCVIQGYPTLDPKAPGFWEKLWPIYWKACSKHIWPERR